VRRIRIVVLCSLAVLLAAWLTRGPVLVAMGDLLVSEDAIQETEWLVLSGAQAGATALEGIQLYRETTVKNVLIVSWRRNPVQERLEALGVPQPTPSDLIETVLERGGVPRGVVRLAPGGVDGTESEIRAVAEFAGLQGVKSLLYVTSRTHTARARYLLERHTRHAARILVRAPRFDSFTSADWWHDRDQTRDVLIEYLRWMNSLLLADRWRPQRTMTSSPATAPVSFHD
jgi:uncharacterized SAM-binding protein YcdF (DUF218 family)